MKEYKIIGIKKQEKRFKKIEETVMARIGEIKFPINLKAVWKDSLGVMLLSFQMVIL